MGQLDPFKCVCSNMGSSTHSFPLLLGTGRSSRKSGTANFVPKRPSFLTLSQCHWTLFFTLLPQLSNFTNNWHGNITSLYKQLSELCFTHFKFPANHAADTCFLWHFSKALHRSLPTLYNHPLFPKRLQSTKEQVQTFIEVDTLSALFVCKIECWHWCHFFIEIRCWQFCKTGRTSRMECCCLKS